MSQEMKPAQTTRTQKILEKIVPRLKENATQSEQLLSSEVNMKIEELIRTLEGMMEKNTGSQETRGSLFIILNSLENIRYAYLMDIVSRTTKDYKTYSYILELLCNESSIVLGQSAKVVMKEIETRNESKTLNQERTSRNPPKRISRGAPISVERVVNEEQAEKPQEVPAEPKYAFRRVEK